MTEAEKPRRSVSQLNQYVQCPMAYKLSRIDKAWQRPAAWLPQGSAFHIVAELLEVWETYGMPLSIEEAKAAFGWAYSNEVSEYTEVTPNFDFWSWSGPYSGGRDLERRYLIGIEQVLKFYAWRELVGQEIWVTPDGTPAIELSFEIDLDGIIVRGYIDAVIVEDGVVRVRDYKTGNSPGDDFQLAVYALAVRKLFGADVWTGDYFMAGKRGVKCGPTGVYDLSVWTEELITKKFHAVEELIQRGVFTPDPEPKKCQFCSVNRACPAYGSTQEE